MILIRVERGRFSKAGFFADPRFAGPRFAGLRFAGLRFAGLRFAGLRFAGLGFARLVLAIPESRPTPVMTATRIEIVLDAWSRRIVGWAMSTTLRRRLRAQVEVRIIESLAEAHPSAHARVR